MKNEKILGIICFIDTALVILLTGLLTFGSSKLVETRRLNDELTERLTRATDINRQLTGTVTECQEICRGLELSTSRDILTIKDAVDTIEETRTAIGAIESQLGLVDTDELYSWYDSYVGME